MLWQVGYHSRPLRRRPHGSPPTLVPSLVVEFTYLIPRPSAEDLATTQTTRSPPQLPSKALFSKRFEDAMAPLAGGQTDRQRQVRLACARVPHQQHILATQKKFAARRGGERLGRGVAELADRLRMRSLLGVTREQRDSRAAARRQPLRGENREVTGRSCIPR